ncbi:PAS domain-containing protein [Govanella unica]|uniref:PAS domain-containing protein n=1 Tax=Govanella unica TaxID=2975056 RepID=A0A9X3TZV8_9PROT|nr:PAS domain-containing protein [Govania unica]MDA5194846.1 PAS domain-containing protein [Govania unica]
MQIAADKTRAYYSQSPSNFVRHLNIGEYPMFFSVDVRPTSSLGSAINQEFFTYWSELAAAAGGTPDRKSFDPSVARRSLPYISLIEKTGDDYRIRLTGTETDRVLGFVGRGRLLSDLPPVFAQKWRPIFHHVIEHNQPFLYHNRISRPEFKPVEKEVICVPFVQPATPEAEAGDSCAPTLIMSCFDICLFD